MREFKVGDRVRLTGHSWPVKRLLGKPALGDVVILTRITDTGIPLFTRNHVPYCIAPADGYGAEYVDPYDVTPTPGKDEVNPSHYGFPGGVQVIDITKHLDFLAGNVVKYVCRAGLKGDKLTDLRKAKQYLEWLIEKEEGK